MKKVLITGALGFIGSKLLEKFKKEQYHVIGWDRNDAVFEDVSINAVEMSSIECVYDALKNYEPDIIVHCAGSADVRKSVENPEMDYVGNVTVTHNLLFSMHRCGLYKTRLIFLSSAGVYGNPISLPITEDMHVNPLSPYALHKVMCEELCMYFANNYGADIKIARIFSAYGAGLKKQIFWDMHNKLKNYGKLEMVGTGNESRDYIHVVDVVESIYLLAINNTRESIFNVANGEEVTIRRATEFFAEATNVGKENIFFNGVVREGDPLNWRADISRIKKLGYKKTINIEEGIHDYAKWCKYL